MGPPPKQFLERSELCGKYWDAEGEIFQFGSHKLTIDLTTSGNWVAATPIPEQTLETRERRLEGQDRELLLVLVRKILRWLPEERPSAQDLFEDDFILRFTSEVDSTPP